MLMITTTTTTIGMVMTTVVSVKELKEFYTAKENHV